MNSPSELRTRSVPFIHHFDGDVGTITFALIAPDTSRFLDDLIPFQREDTGRADLHAEDTALAVNFIPEDI